MRKAHFVALAAMAMPALVACVADTAKDDRQVTVQPEGVQPLAADAGPTDSGASGSKQVQQYKAASNVAVVSVWDYYTGNQLNLRAGKGTDNKIHIDLFQTGWDPTSQVCIDPGFPPDPYFPPPTPYCFFTRRQTIYAYGTVPSGSWRATGTFSQIRADIANGPTMTVTSCVEDWYNYPYYTCGPHAGGLVDVTWHENDWYSSTVTGSRDDSWGLFSMRVSGSFTTKGADTAGSIFGTSVDGAQGQIFRSAGSSISFSSYIKP